VLTLQMLARHTLDELPGRADVLRRRLDDTPIHILEDHTGAGCP